MPSWTTDLLIMQHLSLYLIFIALNLPSEINIAILTLFPVVLAHLSPSFYFQFIGTSLFKVGFGGNSLAIQWLQLHAFTAEGPGSILVQGTKIPHFVQRGQKKFF